MRTSGLEALAIAGAAALGALLLFGQLSHPLFWADEAETAMFGQRVLEYGYPKVHDGRNVVYQFGPNIALGVREGPDAYIGTTWGHFYFAVPGLLWARGAEDPYVRTFRVRLPFALAGALGVAVWVLALLPVFAGDPRRQRRFAALYLLGVAVSISLLLHLREVRYYALLVLLAAALFRVHLGYAVYARVGYRRWCVELALLLWLLFNVFFQAWFAFMALLGLERAWAAWRGEGGLRDAAPFALAALGVAPLLVFFETFGTARAFAAGFGFTPSDYLANLGAVALHFLHHEFLAPALLCRAAVLATGAGSPTGRRVAGGLSLFALGYVALGCVNPLALERYFVVLSPLVTGVFLLDAFALVQALARRARPEASRRAARLATAGIAVLTVLLRLPAFAAVGGRLAEIRTPVRGDLDFAIPALLSSEPDPAGLVIATNYEEYAFMYYLGSQVIVGLALNNIVRDRQLEPDVVVPRRRWPQSLRELRPFLERGEWVEQRFPVRDLHFNNVPALSRSRFIPEPHRFRTAWTDDPDAQFVIYRRSDSEKRTGTSSRP